MRRMFSRDQITPRRRRLDAHCPQCDRWMEIDLPAVVAADHGDRRLPFRVR